MATAPHIYQRADEVLPESVCVCGKHWYHEEHFDGNRASAKSAYVAVVRLHNNSESSRKIHQVITALTLADSKPIAAPAWLPTPPKFRSVEEADAWMERAALSAEEPHPPGRTQAATIVVVAGNYQQALTWGQQTRTVNHRNSIVIPSGHGMSQLHGIRCANVYYVGTWYQELTQTQLDELYIMLTKVDAWHFGETGGLVETDWRGELNRRQHSGAMIASMPVGVLPDLPF